MLHLANLAHSDSCLQIQSQLYFSILPGNANDCKSPQGLGSLRDTVNLTDYMIQNRVVSLLFGPFFLSNMSWSRQMFVEQVASLPGPVKKKVTYFIKSKKEAISNDNIQDTVICWAFVETSTYILSTPCILRLHLLTSTFVKFVSAFRCIALHTRAQCLFSATAHLHSTSHPNATNDRSDMSFEWSQFRIQSGLVFWIIPWNVEFLKAQAANLEI